VEELTPLVETAKPQCRVRVDGAGQTKVCSKPSGLLAELGRANRRAELQTQIDKASVTLNAAPGRAANTDTRALGRYLDAIGLEVSADRLNDLLTILAVVMIEAGGGLALALGLALTPTTRTPAEHPAGHSRTPAPDTPDASTEQPERPVSGVRSPAVRSTTVADWLALAGGRAQTSIRRLAAEIGRSPSAVHDELRKLSAAGVIAITAGPRGTLIEARAN
jgi:hypothetical protein